MYKLLAVCEDVVTWKLKTSRFGSSAWRQRIKKESGENPERTGHCEWWATFYFMICHLRNKRWEGVRERWTMSQETCQNDSKVTDLPGLRWAHFMLFLFVLFVYTRSYRFSEGKSVFLWWKALWQLSGLYTGNRKETGFFKFRKGDWIWEAGEVF